MEINYDNKAIENGVNKVCDAVAKTFGPNGKTMIITDDFGRPYATKDGVSVANSIVLKDPSEHAVATLVKQAAQETVKKAGDGTTTSMILTRELFKRGVELLETLTLPEINSELDALKKSVFEHLDKNTVILGDNEIYDVAIISANNDEHIAELVTKAYKHSDTVKVEETSKEESSVETVKGLSLDTPFFDSAFITNMSKQSIEYSESTAVIMINGALNDPKVIAKLVDKINGPVAIIADHFSKTALNIFKSYFNKNGNLALIKTPGIAGHRENLVRDICKYFNIEPFDPLKAVISVQNVNKYIGESKSLFSNKHKTIFYNPNADMKEHVKHLKAALKLEDDTGSKELLKQRIDNLSGGLSIIKVGGNSQIEIKEKKDRIDDAVLAVKCAIDEGIVEGGGNALLKAMLQTEINEFKMCIAEPYKIIFKDRITTNNIVMFDLDENLMDKKIFDPVKVTKTALENSISVVKVLLSTSGIILNPRLWN